MAEEQIDKNSNDIINIDGSLLQLEDAIEQLNKLIVIYKWWE